MCSSSSSSSSSGSPDPPVAPGPKGPPQQWGPGAQGAPWAPWGGAQGPPWGPRGPLGPLGPQIHCYGSRINSKPSQKIDFWAFWSPKRCIKKLGFGPRDPHGEIRAGILCRIPVLKSQMVGWRPVWWRKGVTWGPLGFRTQPAHPAGGRRADGRANSDPTGVHPPTQDCYPPAGGDNIILSYGRPATEVALVPSGESSGEHGMQA